MTPNGNTLRALREARKLSIRALAERAGINPSHLSRIERGLAGVGEEKLDSLAKALGVTVADIPRGDEVPPTKLAETQREVPYPGTQEGSLFHYTPEEAARFLPWSALQLRRKAYAREIPFNDGGNRVSFTGRDIQSISDMTAVRPLTEAARTA